MQLIDCMQQCENDEKEEGKEGRRNGGRDGESDIDGSMMMKAVDDRARRPTTVAHVFPVTCTRRID